MRSALPFVLLLAAAACSNADSTANQPAVRDSAGIAIVEHTAEGWERAPSWKLSAEPLAVIAGGDDEGAIDLSNSQLGTMLVDGRVVAATMQPPQIYVFSADGESNTMLGRGGDGPGEYRFLAALFPLGGDSVVAYDIMNRRGLLFSASGEVHEPIQFPMTAMPIPPVMSGRLSNGTWVFQVVDPITKPPQEQENSIYRLTLPVLTWRAGAEGYDTAFSMLGTMSKQGTVSAGGQSMTMGRNIGFGSTPFVGGRRDMIWSTTGDQFVISGRDTSGTLRREVRVALPIRPVLEADRERFKTVVREQLERFASMMPPGLLESELAKIEETPFAEHHPAIGQMIVDHLGRIWVTPNLPLVDSTATWGVFDAEGDLLGKVVVPAGMLYAASEDRIVIRREDDETGLVRLEVWGLQREQ